MSCQTLSDLHYTTVAQGLHAGVHSAEWHRDGHVLADAHGFGCLTINKTLKLANKLAYFSRYPKDRDLDTAFIHNNTRETNWATMLNLVTCLIYQLDQFNEEDQSNDALFVRSVTKVLTQYTRSIFAKNAQSKDLDATLAGAPWTI